MHVLMIVL